MPEILALRQLRQKDHKFKGSVGYTEWPYLKKQTTNNNNKKETLSPLPLQESVLSGQQWGMLLIRGS